MSINVSIFEYKFVIDYYLMANVALIIQITGRGTDYKDDVTFVIKLGERAR